MHLAEFNKGTLRYDWDDRRVRDFTDNLERVNALATRSPGYVWHMPGDEMEAQQLAADGPLGGNARMASTLSVWEDVKSLEQFVWKTVHKQFYDRKAEWFAPTDAIRLVLWWVPRGHRPTVAEAMERFRHLEQHGDSDFAFGWSYVAGAQEWKAAQCGEVA